MKYKEAVQYICKYIELKNYVIFHYINPPSYVLNIDTIEMSLN